MNYAVTIFRFVVAAVVLLIMSYGFHLSSIGWELQRDNDCAMAQSQLDAIKSRRPVSDAPGENDLRRTVWECNGKPEHPSPEEL